MTKEIVKYESVTKSFGNKIALDNVSFGVHEGEIFGIIGMSGSGKTTLLKILVGFLEPEYGDVKYLSDLSPTYEQRGVYLSALQHKTDIKRVFGFAAQIPSFYEKLSCKENLEYFASLYGVKNKIAKRNTAILLKLMGLHEARNTLGMNLSGGMQKRLDIACALVHDPKILVLDEPTANLDPVLRKSMWDLIKKINSGGTTVIIASHFLDEIESLCDRVVITHNGKIKEIGSPTQLRKTYSQREEIHIETSPGNYALIAKHLEKHRAHIQRLESVGHKLIIHTAKSEAFLMKLLKTLDECKEILLSLEINKSSIREVFETLIKETMKK